MRDGGIDAAEVEFDGVIHELGLERYGPNMTRKYSGWSRAKRTYASPAASGSIGTLIGPREAPEHIARRLRELSQRTAGVR